LLGEHIIETKDQQEMVGILGRNDEFLRIIQGLYPETTMVARGTKVVFSGEDRDVEELEQLFGELLFLYRQGLPLTTHDVRYSVYMVKNKSLDRLHDMYADTIIVTHHGRRVNAKTLGQWDYVQTIRKNFITFGIGPAGTGKTYLAVALAVTALKNRDVERIILTRPAVEAGGKAGLFTGRFAGKGRSVSAAFV
jgi:phosphate starvation-inducible PhoH-like protein